MPTTYYETKEELDDAFEDIESINREHSDLKEAVHEAEYALAEAKDELKIKDEEFKDLEKELRDFEEENQEFLLS